MAWNYLRLDMRPEKLKALTQFWIDAGEGYGLGSKIDDLPSFKDPDHKVDCSGFVRWLIWHAVADTGNSVDKYIASTFPDGSWNQEQWVKSRSYKKSGFDAGLLKDGAVRIAFKDGRIRHVVLIANGMTFESHGGKGPAMRRWGSKPWMKRCTVYVLTPPEGM